MKYTMYSDMTGSPVPDMLRFHFVARLSILLHALFISSFAWLMPNSIINKLLLGNGSTTAKYILVSMTSVAIIGVLDVFINDVLPARWSLPCIQRNRHIGYSMLGAIFLAQIFASPMSLPPGGYILLVYHLASSGICALFAIAATLRPSHAL